MFGLHLVAVDKFVAEFAVGLVQIQAKAAAQQRCHLVDVLSQFVYVAGLSGVVAGGLYATRGSLIALEAYHVVGLPAVQGDRSLLQSFDSFVGINA